MTTLVRVTQGVLDDLAKLAPWRRSINLTTLPPFARFPELHRNFRRWRASTQPSIVVNLISRKLSPCRADLPMVAFAATGFMACLTSFLYRGCANSRPILQKGVLSSAHLGNGASMCARSRGDAASRRRWGSPRSTALDRTGTRCGAIDPGVILYLMQEHGMDAKAIENLIYRQSGLLPVSGVSSDMRALRASSDPAAKDAIEMFVYRIVRELGSLVAALGGIDGLGVLRRDRRARPSDEVASRERLTMDRRSPRCRPELPRRRANPQCVDSPVSVWTIPTDEERLIARHTAALLTRA